MFNFKRKLISSIIKLFFPRHYYSVKKYILKSTIKHIIYDEVIK